VDAALTSFVSVLIRLTVAPATTFPDFSVTVPAIEPVAVWANNLGAQISIRNKTAQATSSLEMPLGAVLRMPDDRAARAAWQLKPGELIDITIASPKVADRCAERGGQTQFI
jgi:hypothetical protein